MLISNENINRKEILRYLSMPENSYISEINELIELMISEALKIIRPKYVFSVFEKENVPKGILIKNTELVLQGKSIYNHLKDSKKVVIMAATLGLEIEQLIKRYNNTDLTKALILDSVATEIIEKYCDNIEAEIISSENVRAYHPNFRFSPGYGDLSIEIQPQILSILNAFKKIGLSCSENNIMIPRKSVTAIIGLFETLPEYKTKVACDDCSFRLHCQKRKEGNICGHKG